MKREVDISAWGAQPPEFIQQLAALVEETGSRAAAAKKLSGLMTKGKVSRTSVSLLLDNKYTAEIGEIEQKISAALCIVSCPVLGEITSEECQKHREAKFTPSNPQRIQLFRACQGCPRNCGEKQ